MQIRNVGIVSPGDMGQAIAGRLKESGLNVYAALDGRSARRGAGIIEQRPRQGQGELQAEAGRCCSMCL